MRKDKIESNRRKGSQPKPTPTPTPTPAPTQTGSFSWKGYTWERRDYGGDPMYNGQYLPANVSNPDANGYVTLSITNPTGNSPYGAEMYSDKQGWGYGTYTIVVGTPLNAVPSGVVFGGLFTYDDTTTKGDTAITNNEIDICETSNWGAKSDPVQTNHNYFENIKGVKTENADYFNPTGDVVTTHVLTWAAGELTFDSYIGAGTTGTVIRHTVQTSKIPVPALEFLDINLWVFKGASNKAANTAPYSVVVRDFSFTPA